MKGSETSSTCPEGCQPSCTHLCARAHGCKAGSLAYRALSVSVRERASSIDMFKNDVGKRFMKYTLYFTL
jgi:hypothetical protein